MLFVLLQLHENEEKKEGENDNVVYADLDKSALGTGKYIFFVIICSKSTHF